VEEPLDFLVQWYRGQCDGDWEHQFGIEIGTLDNPGWQLQIDLVGTSLEGRRAEVIRKQRSENDWLHYWSDGLKFEAACGTANLDEALQAFREFAFRP
jgi:hypothetical protein